LGIKDVVMLSGDKREIVADYAAKLGIKEAHGELLPQDKAEYVERIAATPGKQIAFVGDGMNDAPVLALSNVGVAMGGLGSDAAIESADVVIQTDQPSRIATAIKIGRTTHTIITENIVGAIGIKVLILTLGALGYASLWAAVFADVGVALLAVMNSMRIMWKRY
ncbi:MAG: HAD-IC family P-type ATPase, partial [Muribaculaceae bacterium]|nr:HAD-IC family P-type ATPase [Muribaculaceae bacterium]